MTNKKGQFFSLDLIIAMGVFVFVIALFLNASDSVTKQTNTFNEKKLADETAHTVLHSLIYSPGEPSYWENLSFSEINSFGLAHSINLLDAEKISRLSTLLNNSSEYPLAKEKLGAGVYDFYFRLTDSSGNTINYNDRAMEGGALASELMQKYSYKRPVIFLEEASTLEVIFSK
ncbi:MAG: hypothetical protein NTY48_01250 [Candidatus Diapherotrites archaeon]|nr:hypothetical protein [Candidatus Diapherotrites archaeon]